jgi:hemin uptake protein HemP
MPRRQRIEILLRLRVRVQKGAGAMRMNAQTTVKPRAGRCLHKDGSPCHCSAKRLLGESVIESDYLFATRNEVQIRHAGEVYMLRLTKNGKLILNK